MLYFSSILWLDVFFSRHVPYTKMLTLYAICTISWYIFYTYPYYIQSLTQKLCIYIYIYSGLMPKYQAIVHLLMRWFCAYEKEKTTTTTTPIHYDWDNKKYANCAATIHVIRFRYTSICVIDTQPISWWWVVQFGFVCWP